MYQVLVVLKNHILSKKYVVDQLPNKVPTMQCAALSIMKKRSLYNTFCRSAESSNIFKGKCLWWKHFFFKDASLEFIPAISLKTDSNTKVSTYGFFVVFFKIIGEFSARYLCKTFSEKVAAFKSIGCYLIGNNVFDKIYRATTLVIIFWNFIIF